jgi:hypothetical protein
MPRLTLCAGAYLRSYVWLFLTAGGTDEVFGLDSHGDLLGANGAYLGHRYLLVLICNRMSGYS